MKHLLLLCSLFLLTFLSGEEPSEIPITYYPRYEAQDTLFEKQFNHISIPEDKVAFSQVRVFKQSFDFSSTTIPREQCMTAIFSTGVINGPIEETLKGTYGVALLLEQGNVPSTTELRYLKEKCRLNELVLFIGLDYTDSKKTGNIYDMAKDAEYLTIYAPRILMTDPLKFPKYVKRISGKAHKKNKAIKIEVCVPTATNFAGTQMLAEILNACSPYADRFGIYMNEIPGSSSSAIIITAFLRSKNEKLQLIATRELEYLNGLNVQTSE